MNERIWSPEQQAIFANVANGTGHTVVTAMPGAGKTTTLVAALSHVPTTEKTILLAFNQKIAQELALRAPKHVEVATTHSFGLRLCRSVNRRLQVDKRKQAAHFPASLRDVLGQAEKLASLAKATLAESPADLLALVNEHEIDIGKMPLDTFCQGVYDGMVSSSQDNMRVDFDDMIWIPNIFSLKGPGYDRVFIDEAQDFTPAQLELALSACREGGRILAVGDPRQAISSFRGASLDSMERLTERLSAEVLSLPVSYRCASSIVAEAQTVVPEIRSAPNADAGKVEGATLKEMERNASPGDFIISRVNAPWVSLCFAFIRAGKRANIAGRDVGKSLRALIEKGQKRRDVSGLPSFLAWLDTYAESERAKLHAAKKETTALDDKIACVEALCDGAESIPEVLARCESLFTDDDDSGKIILTSTHKAKGLERERCFVLRGTYRKRPGLEEDNLYYVAVTRAKKELYLVA